MLPVLILIVPPSVAGGGYATWYLGQQAALSLTALSSRNKRNDADHEIAYTTGSYIAGIATLGSAYGILSSRFHLLEYAGAKQMEENTNVTMRSHSSSKHVGSGRKAGYEFIPPHKQAQSQQFQPPKTMSEAIQRMGRPVLIRAGAGCIAFFCSGLVQTLVATGMQKQ